MGTRTRVYERRCASAMFDPFGVVVYMHAIMCLCEHALLSCVVSLRTSGECMCVVRGVCVVLCERRLAHAGSVREAVAQDCCISLSENLQKGS